MKHDVRNIHTSEAAKKRLAKRYRFESIFKLFGMLSVLVAATFLVLLLSDVFYKASGALTEHYIELDVKFDKSVVDPEGKADPEEIGQKNLDKLWKDAIKEKFPFVTDRRQKFELYGLFSDVVGAELRNMVKADTSLIDQTIKAKLLTDDDTDLYLKGYAGTLKQTVGAANATPVQEGDKVKVVIESNILNDTLVSIKKSLVTAAKRLRLNAKQQERAVKYYEGQLKIAKNEKAIEELKKSLTVATTQRDQYIERAEALEKKAATAGGEGVLTRDLASKFIEINGGVVKAEKVTGDTITGIAVIPLKSFETAKSGEWKLLVIDLPESGS